MGQPVPIYSGWLTDSDTFDTSSSDSATPSPHAEASSSNLPVRSDLLLDWFIQNDLVTPDGLVSKRLQDQGLPPLNGSTIAHILAFYERIGFKELLTKIGTVLSSNYLNFDGWNLTSHALYSLLNNGGYFAESFAELGIYHDQLLSGTFLQERLYRTTCWNLRINCRRLHGHDALQFKAAIESHLGISFVSTSTGLKGKYWLTQDVAFIIHICTTKVVSCDPLSLCSNLNPFDIHSDPQLKSGYRVPCQALFDLAFGGISYERCSTLVSLVDLYTRGERTLLVDVEKRLVQDFRNKIASAPDPGAKAAEEFLSYLKDNHLAGPDDAFILALQLLITAHPGINQCKKFLHEIDAPLALSQIKNPILKEVRELLIVQEVPYSGILALLELSGFCEQHVSPSLQHQDMKLTFYETTRAEGLMALRASIAGSQRTLLFACNPTEAIRAITCYFKPDWLPTPEPWPATTLPNRSSSSAFLSRNGPPRSEHELRLGFVSLAPGSGVGSQSGFKNHNSNSTLYPLCSKLFLRTPPIEADFAHKLPEQERRGLQIVVERLLETECDLFAQLGILLSINLSAVLPAFSNRLMIPATIRALSPAFQLTSRKHLIDGMRQSKVNFAPQFYQRIRKALDNPAILDWPQEFASALLEDSSPDIRLLSHPIISQALSRKCRWGVQLAARLLPDFMHAKRYHHFFELLKLLIVVDSRLALPPACSAARALLVTGGAECAFYLGTIGQILVTILQRGSFTPPFQTIYDTINALLDHTYTELAATLYLSSGIEHPELLMRLISESAHLPNCRELLTKAECLTKEQQKKVIKELYALRQNLEPDALTDLWLIQLAMDSRNRDCLPMAVKLFESTLAHSDNPKLMAHIFIKLLDVANSHQTVEKEVLTLARTCYVQLKYQLNLYDCCKKILQKKSHARTEIAALYLFELISEKQLNRLQAMTLVEPLKTLIESAVYYDHFLILEKCLVHPNFMSALSDDVKYDLMGSFFEYFLERGKSSHITTEKRRTIVDSFVQHHAHIPTRHTSFSPCFLSAVSVQLLLLQEEKDIEHFKTALTMLCELKKAKMPSKLKSEMKALLLKASQDEKYSPEIRSYLSQAL